MTNLTLTHLRIDCIATAVIKLGRHYAGNNLRNALANVMLRATCPKGYGRYQPPQAQPSDAHVAACPACWLLAANLDPGSVVRAYAVVPPMPARHELAEGERFAFGLTLFGDGFQFLPYFVLALNEAGQREGIGPGRREGEGRFVVEQITAVDPLRGESEMVLAPGENLVQVPGHHIDWTAVCHVTDLHLQHLPANNELTVRFRTPTRLEEKDRLYKTPDFAVFFRRLLYRIDDLGRHFAGQERRDRDDVVRLNGLADRVRLVEARTDWHELWVHSGRKQRRTPVGGLTGTAVYYSDDWSSLMPWLVLGQATQVGKSVVKGNGAYELGLPGAPCYWDWLETRER